MGPFSPEALLFRARCLALLSFRLFFGVDIAFRAKKSGVALSKGDSLGRHLAVLSAHLHLRLLIVHAAYLGWIHRDFFPLAVRTHILRCHNIVCKQVGATNGFLL